MLPTDPGAKDSQRKANVRLAWILASTALVFAVGFVAKIWLLSN